MSALAGQLWGHCSLGYSVPLSSSVRWDTMAWVTVYQLSWAVGWDTVAWVRVSALAGLLGGKRLTVTPAPKFQTSNYLFTF